MGGAKNGPRGSGPRGETVRRGLHRLAMAAGLAVGIVLVLLVFLEARFAGGFSVRPRFPLGEFVRELPQHGRWLAGFAAFTATLSAWRALVWRIVIWPEARFADVYHATAMGALLHNTLPGKVGPVAAAWLLARMARRPFAPLLSSQLLAKLLELGVIVVAGAAAALLLGSALGVGRVAFVAAGAFVVLAGAALLVARTAPGAAARLSRRFPRAGAFVAALGEGLRCAGGPARLGAAAACALGPALTAAGAYAVPLAAFGVERPVLGGAIVVAAVAIGQLVPGLPVGTGIYWALSSWAARGVGASDADAAALALVTHAGLVGTQVVVGGISAIVRRGGLGDAFRRRRAFAGASSGAMLRRAAP